MNIKKRSNGIALIISVLAMSLSLSYVVLAAPWAGPTAAPPGNNTDIPLNVGDISQVKGGGLILNTGGAPNGLSVANGKVGIGTLSPDAKLHVLGISDTDNDADNVYVQGISNSPNFNPSLVFRRSRGNSIATMAPVQNGDTLMEVLARGYNNGSFSETANIRMSVDGVVGAAAKVPSRIDFFTTNNAGVENLNLTVKNDGKVGIGTANPQSLLHLKGTSEVDVLVEGNSPDIKFIDAQDLYDTWRAGLDNDTGNFEITLNQKNALPGSDPETKIRDVLTIEPDGKVGIGTTDPSAQLHLMGNSNTDLASDNMILETVSQNADNSANIWGVRARGLTNLTKATVQANDELLEFDGVGYVGVDGNKHAAVISLYTDGPYAGGFLPGKIIFNTTSPTGYRTLADPQMILKSNGRIGIGTGDPNTTLHIVPGEIKLESKNALEYTDIHFSNNRAAAPLGREYVIGNYAPDMASVDLRNKFFIRDNSGGGERFILDASGNVGIGVINPAQKLDVAGGIHAVQDICTDAGGGKCLSTVAGGGGLWAASGTDIYNSNTGNVGIGKSSPTAKLHLLGDDLPGGNPLGTAMWFFAQGSGELEDSGKVWLQYGQGGAGFGGAPWMVMSDLGDASRIQFQQTGTGTYSVPQFSSWIGMSKQNSSDISIMGGNVGIGTATPFADSKLHVYNALDHGEIRTQTGVNNKAADIHFVAGPAAEVNWQAGAGGSAYAPLQNKFFISDQNAGAIRMVIDGAGNLGVGTSNPASKLDVSGDLKISGTQEGIGPGAPANYAGLYMPNVDVVVGGGPDAVFAFRHIDQVGKNNHMVFGNQDIGGAANGPVTMTINSEYRRVGIGLIDSSVRPNANLDIRMSNAVPTEGLHISRNAAMGFSYLDIENESAAPIFKVHESGNVGIGTGNPGAKLQISPDMTNNSPRPLYVKNDATTEVGATTAAFTNNLDIGLAIGAKDGADYATIEAWQFVNGRGVISKDLILNSLSYGRVGINTINPLGELDINMKDLTSTEGLHISRDATPLGNHYAYLNILDEFDQSVFKVHESGNIGIGTSDPGAAAFSENSGKVLDIVSDEVLIRDGSAEINFIDQVSGGVPANNNWRIGTGSTDYLAITMQDSDWNIGTSTVIHMLRSGYVGIGKVPVDKLDVNGDLRVGTGTTGCVKDADGSVISGTCSSDIRLKKDIMPLKDMLGAVSSLRPVSFNWRSNEYPEMGFGSQRQVGLIAQDVEKVMPELVSEDDKGFKRVDYSDLSMMMLQSIKELKAENDALKARIEVLEAK